MAAEQEQPKERKTLDERAKMTELERIRHSAAHVMATAILRLWPEAQFASFENPGGLRPLVPRKRSTRLMTD